MAIDPVCGMEVEGKNAAATYKYVVLDKSRMAPVVKPFEALCEGQLSIKLAQKQKTAVRGDLPAVEIENEFRLKTKRELSKTLCSHRSSVFCLRLMW